MKNARFFAWLTLAAGIAASSASTLSAQDYRDRNHDSYQVSRMRAEIARDRARLAEDLRYGRRAAARQDRLELARDQRSLDAQHWR
jgi:hypothetical protein